MKAPVSLSAGDTIANRYRLLKKTSDFVPGGMLPARDLELDLDVLIQFIDPCLARNPEKLDKIKRRMVVFREISHPNVVKVFNLDRYREGYFITMQSVDGISLKRFLASSEPLEWNDFLTMVEDLLSLLKLNESSPAPLLNIQPDYIAMDSRHRLVLIPPLSFHSSDPGGMEPGSGGLDTFIGFLKGIRCRLRKKGRPVFRSEMKKLTGILRYMESRQTAGSDEIRARFRRTGLGESRVPPPCRWGVPLAGIVVGLLFFWFLPRLSGPVKRDKILIVPVTVLAPAGNLAGWENRFVTTVQTFLRAHSGYPVMTALEKGFWGEETDRSEQKRYARQKGIRWMVRGRIHQAGSVIEVDLWVTDPFSGSPVFSDKERISRKDLIEPALSRLCWRLTHQLDLSPDGQYPAGFVGQYLSDTGSRGRNKYLEGLQLFLLGRHERSLASFQAARKKDPDCPLTWQKIANLLTIRGQFKEARAYNREALRRSLAPNDLVHPLIQADSHFFFRQDYHAARALYADLYRKYPSWRSAFWGLIRCCFHLESWDQAEVLLSEYLNRFPESIPARLQMVSLYIHLDRPSSAEDLLPNLPDEDPARDRIRFYQGLIDALRGDHPRARSVFSEIRNFGSIPDVFFPGLLSRFCLLTGADPPLQPEGEPAGYITDSYHRGQAFYAQGRLQEAMELFSFLSRYFEREKNPVLSLRTRWQLLWLYHQAGLYPKLFQSSGDLIERQRETEAPPGTGLAFFFRGIAALHTGRNRETSDSLEELRRRSQRGNRISHRLRLYLQARLQEKEGNLESARKLIEEAVVSLPPRTIGRLFPDKACFLFFLGELYEKSGGYEKALDAFQRVSRLSPMEISSMDLVVISHFRMGEIYRLLGWQGKATEAYRRFLEDWKDPDRHFFRSMIMQARQQLER